MNTQTLTKSILEERQQELFAGKRVLFVVNDIRYLLSHRLHLVRFLQSKGVHVQVVSPPEACPKLPGDIPNIPWELARRGMNPWKEWRSLLSLLSIYRREKPDLVHHFTVKPVLYGSMAARFLPGLFVVNNISGLGSFLGPLLRSSSWLAVCARSLFRSILQRKRCSFIFQTEEDRQAFREAGIVDQASQVRILPGSAVEIIGEKHERSAHPTGVLQLVFVGRMLSKKGARFVMDLARKSAREGKAWRFTLIGPLLDGRSRECVQAEEISSWEQETSGRYLGYQENIRPFLAESDVLLFPSIYEEGVPRIILEAAAEGLCMISSRHPGIEVAFRDGESLLVLPHRELSLWFDMIDRVAQDKAWREQLGEQAREALRRGNFTPARFEDELFQLYSLLFSHSTPGAERAKG